MQWILLQITKATENNPKVNKRKFLVFPSTHLTIMKAIRKLQLNTKMLKSKARQVRPPKQLLNQVLHREMIWSVWLIKLQRICSPENKICRTLRHLKRKTKLIKAEKILYHALSFSFFFSFSTTILMLLLSFLCH